MNSRAITVVRSPVVRSGATFFGSRALNAVLLLGQLALVSAWYPQAAAAQFFVIWTVGWCAAVWLRFGFDQLLPKHAAHARLERGEEPVAGFRRLLRRTAPPLAIVLAPLIAGLLPGISLLTAAEAAGACMVTALAWSLTSVLGGLARGYEHVGLAGFVQGVIPAVGALSAVPVAAFFNRSWFTLTLSAAVCLGVSAMLAIWLVAHRVGAGPVRSLLGARASRFDRDLVPAALVSAIGETGLWLPVWLASGLGVGARGVAALYAASRIAAAFSWLAASVAAVATPLLAGALARHDQRELRHLLSRSSALSGVISVPVAIVGIVFASSLMGVTGGTYVAYGGLLVALISGRFVDACTGPLGEALIVGNRARVELVNMVVFAGCVVGLGVALEPGMGVLGLAVATGIALAVCNVTRVTAVAVLLRHGWGSTSPRRVRFAVWAEQAGLFVCAVVAALIAAGWVDRGTTLAFAGALTLVCSSLALVTLGARRAVGGSLTALARSPVSVICVVWALLFVLRPLDLYFDPSNTTVPLFELGFSRAALTWAVAIGALGCSAWGLGYLRLLRAPVARAEPERSAAPLHLAPAAGLLAFGTLLWGALFVRQGGPAALLHHAASIHANQQASFYGIAGVWIVQATGLFALDRFLRGAGRRALAVLLVAAALSAAAAVALEIRGLAVIAALAAVAIYLRARPPSRRMALTGGAIAIAAVAVLGFGERVRSYTQSTSTSHALTLALHTPPSSYAVADMTPFDNLVTIGELVPRSIPRLNGSSIEAIPAAFVPRAVWPAKPQPVDQQVTSYLYPGSSAGSPISMQGELWWNYGWPGVLLGAALLGALMGVFTRRGLFARTESGRLLYAVFFASAFAPMLSAMATMAANTAIALASAAVVAAVLWAPAPLRRGYAALRAWVLEPHSRQTAVLAPTGGARFPLIDSVRGIAATGVLVCHAAALIYAPLMSPYNNWASVLGIVAVDCFFVTSGFVLYRPFVLARARRAPEPSIGSFLTRRLFRITPAYWVALTLTAMLVPAVVPGVLTAHGWMYYLLVSNYAPHGMYAGGMTVAWTLEIELTFYLALPLIAVAIRRLSPPGLSIGRELAAAAVLLIMGVGVVSAVAITESSTVLLRSLAGTVGWFAIGMGIAALSVAAEMRKFAPGRARWLRHLPSLLWIGAVAAFIGAVMQHDFPTSTDPNPLVTPTTYLIMVSLCILSGTFIVVPAMLRSRGRGIVARVLATPLLRWLGQISFGIYLYHYPIIYLLKKTALLPAAATPRAIVLIGLTFVCTTACAALSWYLVERPFIRMSRRRRAARAGAPVVALSEVAA